MTLTIDDATLEAGLAKSGVSSELVEWHGNPEHRVILRIEQHMGHYIERDFWPWMDADDVASKLKRMVDELDERRRS